MTLSRIRSSIRKVFNRVLFAISLVTQVSPSFAGNEIFRQVLLEGNSEQVKAILDVDFQSGEAYEMNGAFWSGISRKPVIRALAEELCAGLDGRLPTIEEFLANQREPRFVQRLRLAFAAPSEHGSKSGSENSLQHFWSSTPFRGSFAEMSAIYDAAHGNAAWGNAQENIKNWVMCIF